jgi:hypothetical protein
MTSAVTILPGSVRMNLNWGRASTKGLDPRVLQKWWRWGRASSRVSRALFAIRRDAIWRLSCGEAARSDQNVAGDRGLEDSNRLALLLHLVPRKLSTHPVAFTSKTRSPSSSSSSIS